MPENICPQCGSPNRESARFCADCGRPLLTMNAGPKPSTPPAVPHGSTPEQAGSIPGSGSILQDRYRLGAELGRGGFGAVYKAWDTHLNRPCAIKENLEASFEAQRQFIREASVLADLHHPNLPRVTDYFLIPNAGQYLVMDFVEGEDLHHLVEKRGPLPIEQAVAWIIQVSQALEYLHEHQPPILHRDIKPANIRITTKGKAMLVDFGLVKLFDPNLRTTIGARAVTPGYAPPEQYGRGMTDARTDVYAIAATLYYALTAEDPLESVQRVSGEHNPRADELNHRVPISLAFITEKGLALSPEERYQSAAEFRMALVNCLRATPASAGFVDTIVQVQSPPVGEPSHLSPLPAGPGISIQSTLATPLPAQPQEYRIDQAQSEQTAQQPAEQAPLPPQPATPKPSGPRPDLQPVQPHPPIRNQFISLLLLLRHLILHKSQYRFNHHPFRRNHLFPDQNNHRLNRNRLNQNLKHDSLNRSHLAHEQNCSQLRRYHR